MSTQNEPRNGSDNWRWEVAGARLPHDVTLSSSRGRRANECKEAWVISLLELYLSIQVPCVVQTLRQELLRSLENHNFTSHKINGGGLRFDVISMSSPRARETCTTQYYHLHLVLRAEGQQKQKHRNTEKMPQIFGKEVKKRSCHTPWSSPSSHTQYQYPFLWCYATSPISRIDTPLLPRSRCRTLMGDGTQGPHSHPM